MNASQPAYATLRDSLRQAGIVLSPAELHGGICGTLAAGGAGVTERWVEECLHDCASGAELQTVREQLRELELDAWRALSGTQMTFEPFIPDEDGGAIELRVQALAVWCHGFLVGLSFGGIALDALPGASDLQEIVEDFLQISRAGLDADEADGSADAGFALAELVEYVRVGTQLAFDELQQLPGPPDTTLH